MRVGLHSIIGYQIDTHGSKTPDNRHPVRGYRGKTSRILTLLFQRVFGEGITISLSPLFSQDSLMLIFIPLTPSELH
jgi:hypothetical protein